MCGFLYALVLLLSVVDCLQTSGVTRGGSGIQIGTSDRSAFGKATGYGGRGHSGVKLGEARFPNSTRQRPYTTPSSTTTWFTYAPPSADKNGYNSTLKVSRNFIDGRGLNRRCYRSLRILDLDSWRGWGGIGSLIFLAFCFFFSSLWKLFIIRGMRVVKMDFYGYSYPSIETIVKKNFVLEIGARRKFGNENGF